MTIIIDGQEFKTTAREDQGIAFAVAHPGDGPTEPAEVVMAMLRSACESNAKQQDAADALENHATYERYAQRSPEKAAYMANVLKEIEAQPEKEPQVLPLAAQIGVILGVEFPR